MPDEGFRLPDSSYDQLTKIVMAYNAFSQPESPSEVAKAIDIHATSISRNGGFLVGVGVLEGANKKLLTSRGRSLSRALQHEMPDEIRRNWREIVATNDFMQKVLSAVRIRKGMERSALQSHIAYSAGQSKTNLVLRGANAVIDILRAAELLKEADGRLLAVTEQAQRTPDSLEIQDGDDRGATGGLVSQRSLTADAIVATQTSGVSPAQGTGITIQIQIQCSVSEVEELGPKLRAMIAELTRSADIDEPSGDVSLNIDARLSE
ncbi:MAG: hypothetical protein ACRDJW_16075 [Thermomicrobiales bacterium]